MSGGGESVGVPALRQAVAALGAVLGRSGPVSRETGTLAVELGRIVIGTSTAAPQPRDRRFTDPAWAQNPVFRRLAQTYLAATGALEALVDDFEASTDDHRPAERARFAANILTAAAAPTNLLATNPAGLKRAFDTGGASVLRGARNAVADYASAVSTAIDQVRAITGSADVNLVGLCAGGIISATLLRHRGLR